MQDEVPDNVEERTLSIARLVLMTMTDRKAAPSSVAFSPKGAVVMEWENCLILVMPNMTMLPQADEDITYTAEESSEAVAERVVATVAKAIGCE